MRSCIDWPGAKPTIDAQITSNLQVWEVSSSTHLARRHVHNLLIRIDRLKIVYKPSEKHFQIGLYCRMSYVSQVIYG